MSAPQAVWAWTCSRCDANGIAPRARAEELAAQPCAICAGRQVAWPCAEAGPVLPLKGSWQAPPRPTIEQEPDAPRERAGRRRPDQAGQGRVFEEVGVGAGDSA